MRDWLDPKNNPTQLSTSACKYLIVKWKIQALIEKEKKKRERKWLDYD